MNSDGVKPPEPSKTKPPSIIKKIADVIDDAVEKVEEVKGNEIHTVVKIGGELSNNKGINRQGKPVKIKLKGWLARIFQHETDHLNGKLFISHVSALKRDLIRRKIRKLQKLGEWE